MIGRKFIPILVALLTIPLAPGVVLGDGQGSAPADPLSPAAPVERADSGVLEPGLLDKLEEGPHGVIVHFEDTVPTDLADIPGIQPSYIFESIPAAYVLADAAGVRTLSVLDNVAQIEDAWTPLELRLDSARIATRVEEVLDPDFEPSPLVIDETDERPTLPDGSTITGQGVGIAVVDSGLDGLHPDFQAPGKQAGNYVVTPAGVVPGGSFTSQGDPHGTHMAGIAAGTGAASDGLYTGAAPGASLSTFATWNPEIFFGGDAAAVQPAIAFDWILQHGQEQSPPIRVVLNGWGCQDGLCDDLDPARTHLQLASMLAEAGYVVVFAAGDDGGDGLSQRIFEEATIQTPGVITVANHDDEEVGGREDCIKSTSGRGDAAEPGTWPDIAAPGDDVWSPNAITPHPESRVPVPDNPAQDSRRSYVQVTGTSASTAHAAGVVALLLEANPTLEPAEVEHILEVTAHKLTGHDRCIDYVRADPSNPWSTANFAAGHGLVDAVDALHLAIDFPGIPDPDDAPDLEPIPEGFTGQGPSLELTGPVFYFDGEDGLSTEPRERGAPLVRTARISEPIVHTSQPLAEAFTASAGEIDLWAGTQAELGLTVGVVGIRMTAERVLADGSGTETVFEDIDGIFNLVPPLLPALREGVRLLDEPVTFEQGDRVQVTVELIPAHMAAPALGSWTVYSDAHPTPSRIAFGERVELIEPGTEAQCRETATCKNIGGDIEQVMVRCTDDFITYHVEWFGPPGSSATVECNTAVATCTVPGGPGAPWSECEATSTFTNLSTGNGRCTVTMPDGTIGGQGRCEIGRPG